MKKTMCLILSLSLLLIGCGGRSAHPIPQYQPGDDSMTCSQIKLEIMDNQSRIMSLIPKENKTGKNVALGVAGYFLLVPWFFMDFSDAERQEVQAYQLRNSWLRVLADKKHCDKHSFPAQIKFKKAR